MPVGQLGCTPASGMLRFAGVNSWRWLIVLGVAATPFAACGPDHRPEEPCEGPSFKLVVRAESKQPLPADTRINIRYGGNSEGEPYELGTRRAPQAVSCSEDTTIGGAPSEDSAGAAGAGAEAGAGGAGNGAEGTDVFFLRCGLYTQGPARLDVTATGYEPIKDEELSFGSEKHCEVRKTFVLVPLKPDAGK